jgi:ubiquinone/menaquinone biosynthesis C-methylase UbiE
LIPEFLETLICPYCGSSFKIENELEKEKEEIISGYVTCECSEFPILSGILILKKNPLNKKIIDLIKKRKIEEAEIRYLCQENFEKINSFNTILDILPIPLKVRLKALQILSNLLEGTEEKNCRKLYKKYSATNITFHKLLGDSFYENYLKHRFSGESLWSIFPFIPVIKNKNEKVLDLCCGVGYTSFILSMYVEPQQLCCADIVFRRLWLARKYFAPTAHFICLDASYPLPFRDKSFTSILMLDAFGYIPSRVLLANEMERIIRSKGLVLILHIHNSFTFNLGGGCPISPKQLSILFSNSYIKTKTISERKVLEDYIFHNKLDLSEEYSERTLNSSNALILLATADKSIFKIYHQVNREFLRHKNHLIINPIYKMKRENNNFVLSRPLDKYALGDMYFFSEDYLLRDCIINAAFLEGRDVHISDVRKVEDLMKKFIVINVPENYI